MSDLETILANPKSLQTVKAGRDNMDNHYLITGHSPAEINQGEFTITGPFPDLLAVGKHIDFHRHTDVIGIFPEASNVLIGARLYAKAILSPSESSLVSEGALLGQSQHLSPAATNR